MQSSESQPDRGFQTNHSEGCALELHLLFVRGMGRVVGCDSIHGSVGQRHQQRLAICRRAQRRIHLAIGVVLAYIFINKSEMVGCDFTSDLCAAALAAADRLQRLGS